jgi:sterol desaturase/sphingolipid hydroxylase (fatty acid hydroxylase superfamily)
MRPPKAAAAELADLEAIVRHDMLADEALYQIVRTAAAGATIALAFCLERWRPHARLRPAWRTNLGLFAIGSLVTAAVCGACGWVVAAWAASRGLGLLAFAGAPLWLAAALGLLGLDAVSYAWHRANHRLRGLWRFHQVHHGDASFHFTTAMRFHPGELLLALPLRLAAVVALGVPPEGVLAFELVFGAANLLEHGNFDLPGRLDARLQPVFVTPALHRGHHAASWQELNTNFGTVLSVWDRLGGTFRAGDPSRAVATGLPDREGREAPALAESLRLPFARGR